MYTSVIPYVVRCIFGVSTTVSFFWESIPLFVRSTVRDSLLLSVMSWAATAAEVKSWSSWVWSWEIQSPLLPNHHFCPQNFFCFPIFLFFRWKRFLWKKYQNLDPSFWSAYWNTKKGEGQKRLSFFCLFWKMSFFSTPSCPRFRRKVSRNCGGGSSAQPFCDVGSHAHRAVKSAPFCVGWTDLYPPATRKP